MGSLRLVLFLCLLSYCLCDLYLNSPSGSNNRANEANAERNNGNRLFDSQNNNRGGYNIGDRSTNAFNTETDPTNVGSIYSLDSNPNDQVSYPMVYYEGSIVHFEWTVQHGCGGNEGTDPTGRNCNMVLQYTCDSDDTLEKDQAMRVKLRDGTTTTQVNENGGGTDTGIHESAAYYAECKTRKRNGGLYLADQAVVAQASAIYTRQNPQGTRRGLECPEERDYYPYWLPTPWRDILYATDRPDLCQYILTNTQNNNTLYKCRNAADATVFDAYTTTACTAGGGTLKPYTFGIAPPECKLGEWSRENHHGNARDSTNMIGYDWKVPSITVLKNSKVKIYTTTNGAEYARCVARMRYNISTDDYNPWTTNSSHNAKNLVTNNPTVDVGADLQGLKLAINTNQFGRTFQDRTHSFYVRTRPTSTTANNAKVYNLFTRGKRGNVVQTYPSVPYDFVPNNLAITTNDFVHIQWTGSNTHNNNPNAENAGDGQGGSEGEGTAGTDRQNFVQISNLADSYPMPLDKKIEGSPNMFLASNTRCLTLEGTEYNSANVVNVPNLGNVNIDCALTLSSSGYYRKVADVTTKPALDGTLNNAPPSLVGGVVMKFLTSGTYNYMSSRNNAPGRRSQKGVIVVKSA